jgi:hypothetical protein
MDWRPYKACCQGLAASDADVAFCPECRNPLLRCQAFAECHSLVVPTGPCPVCVAPTLMIDKGAVVQSKVGERLSVPLILLNASPARRPLWVKRIARLSDGRVEPLHLTWEQLEAGVERRFTLDSSPLAVGGTHTLQLIVVLASRYRGVEEEYAFAAGMSLSVTGTTNQKVVQSVVITGNTFGAGGMNYPKLQADLAAQAVGPAGLENRVMLALERAEKYELDEGIRGYRQERLRVPRHVEFAFSGFGPHERPRDGSLLVPRGRLAFGRNGRNADPPSDVCLRAYDPRTGGIDEPATMALSRHHFDLVVVNDRLCVQARATAGMQVNASALAAGDVLPLGPGDRIVPIPGRPDKLTLQVAFVDSIDSVDRINVARTPVVRTTA